MTAGAWTFYEQAAELLFDGTIDLDTDTFRVVLVTSSYTFSAAHTTWSDASAAEVANGNGYATHGQALAGTSMSQSSGVGTWDATDPDWTASDSGITARRAIIVRDANGDGTLESGDLLICACLLDATPADVTVNAGNHLIIQLNASGIAQAALS